MLPIMLVQMNRARRSAVVVVSLLLLLCPAVAATSEPRQEVASKTRVLRGNVAERNLEEVSIVKFALINADTSQEIETAALDTDGTISVEDLPSTNLNIEAVVEGSIKKVIFAHTVDGVDSDFSRDKNFPYAMCGEKGGKFKSCDSLKEGTHSVAAIAVLGGQVVASREATFTLVSGPLDTKTLPISPSGEPSALQSSAPSDVPSNKPSSSDTPSDVPSSAPSDVRSDNPSSSPIDILADVSSLALAVPSSAPTPAPDTCPFPAGGDLVQGTCNSGKFALYKTKNILAGTCSTNDPDDCKNGSQVAVLTLKYPGKYSCECNVKPPKCPNGDELVQNCSSNASEYSVFESDKVQEGTCETKCVDYEDLLKGFNEGKYQCDCGSPAPSDTPLAFPSSSPSDFPSAVPSLAPSDVPSDEPSASPTDPPLVVLSSSLSDSPSDVPSSAPSNVHSDKPSSSPTDAPWAMPSSSPSDSPSDVPSSAPSDVHSDKPSLSPTDAPWAMPSSSPSDSPSDVPSSSPSDVHSDKPSSSPTDAPWTMPSSRPSDFPSAVPSLAPSDVPSDEPSSSPTDPPLVVLSSSLSDSPSDVPSSAPSNVHSDKPSSSPTDAPWAMPSSSPSDSPSDVPSSAPSDVHSDKPSSSPTDAPWAMSSSRPSDSPSDVPSSAPSDVHSDKPSSSPTDAPWAMPSSSPSETPSDVPSSAPSDVHSDKPSSSPTDAPWAMPSSSPSDSPSDVPSSAPSDVHSDKPSSSPTDAPWTMPSSSPSDSPSDVPSSSPSDVHSDKPSSSPTDAPWTMPSSSPSDSPSDVPSSAPSDVPSDEPSSSPTDPPLVVLSSSLSDSPSDVPSSAPSDVPSETPTSNPSAAVSNAPTIEHSMVPSSEQSQAPSDLLSAVPSDSPTVVHSDFPSNEPSQSPSSQLTSFPSDTPSEMPSAKPSYHPSTAPSDTPSDVPSTSPTDVPPLMPDVTINFMEANAFNTFAIMDPESLAALQAQETDYGIWYWAGYRPHKAHKGIYPGLKGGLIIYHWKDLEPAQGVYDWSKVEEYMTAAIQDGLRYAFALLVGPDSPEWLYESGVPEVFTTKAGWRFPYYFDPLYLESFDKVNQEAISHLMNLTSEMTEALVEVTLNDGATGDPYCYKGDPLDSQYDISKEVWDEFRRENLLDLHDHLGPDGLETIDMAFTHMTDETEAFVHTIFPNVKWYKNGMASHGYHIPEDKSIIDRQRSQAFDGDPSLGGRRVRWFGEMDREWLNSWFQRAPAESFWWSSIYALHLGLSRWHIRGDALPFQEYHFAFDFFNKHGEHIDAATSPYAFCALRDGLDASDTTRFSEIEYGMASGDKLPRLLNILNDFAPYGAVVEDESVTGSSLMGFRQRTGYVDVMYGGESGNYYKFLYQIDPSAESIGWWHVGSKAWPYGRFARSFHSSSGKTAMYFRLEDRFISDKSAPHAAKIGITYFDEGNGSWELHYNAPSFGMQSAVTITCGDTQSWKKVELSLSAMVLDGGLEMGADLILHYISGSDTKFHMIEFDRM